jgi:hypothetical protein
MPMPAETMKAIAVFPGKPGSAHLAEMPKPKIDEIPGGSGPDAGGL